MEFAYLGINKEVLARLIADGHLCAADLRSLDADTKQFLWQTCLWACKKRLSCKAAAEVKNAKTISVRDEYASACHGCDGCSDTNQEEA